MPMARRIARGKNQVIERMYILWNRLDRLDQNIALTPHAQNTSNDQYTTSLFPIDTFYGFDVFRKIACRFSRYGTRSGHTPLRAVYSVEDSRPLRLRVCELNKSVR